MWKRYEFNGGTADPWIISWPSAAAGAIGWGDRGTSTTMRSTSYRPSWTPRRRGPGTIKGHVQSRFRRGELRYSATDPSAPFGPQDPVLLDARLARDWHDGWKAVTAHPTLSGWSDFNDDTWELYQTDVDRPELHDLAADTREGARAAQPAVAEAGENEAFPLDDRSPLEIITTPRPQLPPPEIRHTDFPDTAEVPEAQA